MSLNGNDRAQASFAPIKAANDALIAQGKPASDRAMSQADLDKLLAGLQQHFNADTTYLTSKAEILPGTLASDVGIPVATTGSPAAQTGSSTAQKPLAATGKGLLS